MCRKIRNWLFLIVLFLLASTTIQAQYNSTITGMVFDAETKRPVGGVEVELLNDVYSTVARFRTQSSGRYYFNRLSSGNYKLKILALGTNYVEQTQDVTLVPFVIAGRETPDTAYLDFYLNLNPAKVNIGALKSESVFVQEIPQEALDLYKKAISQLNAKNDAGLITLEKAINIFPDYYDALDLLGNQYVERNLFAKSLPFLIKSIDVNQRSFSSFYALGYACYSLNKRKEAIQAMEAATILHPESVNALLWYGRLLRLDGDTKKAEPYLLKAKSLSKRSPIADISWQLALLYQKLERYNDAANELEEFIKLQPNSRDVDNIKKVIANLRQKAK